MIEPTRADWLERRDQLCSTYSFSLLIAGQVLHDVLGPCPPKPAPEPFRLDAYTLVRIASPYLDKIAVPRHLLTPDEADAMAAALVEHARYAREQEEQSPALCHSSGSCQRPDGHPGAHSLDESYRGPPSPVCGRVLVGQGTDTWDPVCQRPDGHPGACKAWTP